MEVRDSARPDIDERVGLNEPRDPSMDEIASRSVAGYLIKPRALTARGGSPSPAIPSITSPVIW